MAAASGQQGSRLGIIDPGANKGCTPPHGDGLLKPGKTPPPPPAQLKFPGT